jgi:anti-sigma factor RsiW
MNCLYGASLDAYYDGELSADAAQELEEHVATCPACLADLEEIREVSRAFEKLGAEGPSASALTRAHQAAESAVAGAPSPVLRVAGTLASLAASVLVIASAWLWESSGEVVQPRPVSVTLPAPVPEWERVAMTLEPGPLPEGVPDSPERQMLADVRCADWMLRNMEGGR